MEIRPLKSQNAGEILSLKLFHEGRPSSSRSKPQPTVTVEEYLRRRVKRYWRSMNDGRDIAISDEEFHEQLRDHLVKNAPKLTRDCKDADVLRQRIVTTERRKWIDVLRRARRHQRAQHLSRFDARSEADAFATLWSTTTSSPDEAAIRDETEQLLRDYMERLPKELAEPFVLRKLQKRPLAEVQKITGTSAPTIRRRVDKALELLRQFLVEDDIDPCRDLYEYGRLEHPLGISHAKKKRRPKTD